MAHKLLLCSLEHNSFILAKGREQLLNFLGRKIGFLVYSQMEKDAKKKEKEKRQEYKKGRWEILFSATDIKFFKF